MKHSFFHLSGTPESGGSSFMQLMSTPRFQFILIFFLAVFLCTIKLDNGGMMVHDECYYAQKAKEMLKSGDWLTPRFGGRAYHENPPGHMWIIAASYRIFGVSDWAARFPTSVQTVLIVLLTYLLVQWMFDRPWVSLLSASSLLLIDYFYKFARKAHMDHLMTLLFMVAVLTFIAGKRRSQVWFIVSGAAVGFAVLTKSALGLFSLIVIAAYVIIKREWGILKKPFFWVGWMVMVFAVAGWYFYEYSRFGGKFLDVHVKWLLFYRSVFGGITGGDKTPLFFLSKMAKNLYYFIRDSHIWSLMAIAGVVFFFLPWKSGRSDFRGKPDERFLLVLWFLIPLVIMLFAGEFKTWYLMPVFVPLSIFSALFLSRIFSSPGRLRTVNFVVLSLLVLHFAILVVTPYFTLDLKHEIRHPGIRKLATKVRMIVSEPMKHTIHFPATDEIAKRNGMKSCEFSYWSIAQSWAFYSDHPLFPREKQASLEEVRDYMDKEGGICLTTGEGFDVISGDRSLPYEVIGRVVDGRTEYVACCSRSSFEMWRKAVETDFSRAPLYSLREY